MQALIGEHIGDGFRPYSLDQIHATLIALNGVPDPGTGAIVLIGWPVAALTGPDRPLDKLRRDMNAANVLHRYHRRDTDVDDDFYLVMGHHVDASPSALGRAAGTVRDKLAADPIDLEIGIRDVKIVAADTHTMAPPRFVGDIPVDSATLKKLMS